MNIFFEYFYEYSVFEYSFSEKIFMNIMNIHDIHEYLFQKMNIQKLNIHINIQKKYSFEYSCIFLNIYLHILMNIHFIE